MFANDKMECLHNQEKMFFKTRRFEWSENIQNGNAGKTFLEHIYINIYVLCVWDLSVQRLYDQSNQSIWSVRLF